MAPQLSSIYSQHMEKAMNWIEKGSEECYTNLIV